MKITFLVTRSDTIGGSHIHIRDLGIALKRDGHEVHIIIGGQGSVTDLFEDCGLQVITVQSLKRNISPLDDIKAYIEIKNTLKFLKPDIVSTHSSKAGFIGRLAASKLGIPVLFTAHGWSFTAGKSKPARKLYRYLENLIVPKTNYFITVSDYDKSLAQKVLKIPSEKIQTVHNGMVDVPNKYRAEPGKSGIVSIVMVARFDQQKNHVELLKAVKELKNFHIYFVGDGPLLASVKQKTMELGLSCCITFTGYSSSVEKWMANAQIFTLISHWEGFPRSTIEAMRAGLPVIISDVGGAAEAVKHAENGFVVKKGDISSLKKYIKKLIDDSALRKRMGDNARHHYEKHLTFENMYTETMDVYKKLIMNPSND